MNNIKDKVVVITGASSGIGAATAELLASKGANLVLAARKESALVELSDKLIKKYAIKAIYQVTDVTNKNDVESLINFTMDNFKRVDILFNNAGIMPVSMLREGKLNEWEAMIDVNLKGALYGIKYVLPIMEEQKSGHIITMDSVAGHFVGEGSAIYSATKAAIRAVMEGLRVEEVGKGIKSTLISPGHAQTGLASTISDPEMQKTVLENEKNTGLTAQDVANAVAFAINTPANVGINEVLFRSINQKDY